MIFVCTCQCMCRVCVCVYVGLCVCARARTLVPVCVSCARGARFLCACVAQQKHLRLQPNDLVIFICSSICYHSTQTSILGMHMRKYIHFLQIISLQVCIMVCHLSFLNSSRRSSNTSLSPNTWTQPAASREDRRTFSILRKGAIS